MKTENTRVEVQLESFRTNFESLGFKTQTRKLEQQNNFIKLKYENSRTTRKNCSVAFT